MTALQAILLGLIQGATEFLPISSTGHLMLLESFFDISLDPRSEQGFNIMLHAGTLLALLFMYLHIWVRLLCALGRRDAEGKKLIFLLVIATLPAGVIGFIFVENIATANAMTLMAMGFFLNAVVLLIAESAQEKNAFLSLTPPRALLIGFAQALALLPSVSRSALTYGAARLLGISRSEALDFSFLMAFPAIMGAVLLTVWDAYSGDVVFPPRGILAMGFLSSLLGSLLAIILLRIIIRRVALSWFAVYLIPLSLVLLTLR